MGLVKAQIIVEHSGEKLDVMFNPEEYTLNRDNNFASQAVPGLSSPLLQFAHGNLRTLEMELLFDTYERQQGDVRQKTEKLIRLMDINPELHAPPVLLVSWASLQFRGVLTRAAQKFILFLSDGRPVRARVNCAFTEYIDPEREAKQVSRQTTDYTKHHIVIDGETISGIANKHYRNPQLWRAVARANRIDDPRALEPGRSLLIPSLPFVDAESGEVFR